MNVIVVAALIIGLILLVAFTCGPVLGPLN